MCTGSTRARACSRSPATAETPVEYSRGDALALPFGDEQFDVAVSTQVYEYVDDIEGALAEARRALRPGGRLLVLDTDWDSIVWHSSDRERMERVLAAWNEHLADPYLPRRLPALMRAAGLELADAAIIPILNHGAGRNTYSAGMLRVVAAYVAGRGGVTTDEATAWADDLRASAPTTSSASTAICSWRSAADQETHLARRPARALVPV